MDHLCWDTGSCAGGACFEVELRGSAARVCLMDVDHYQAYLNGDEYEYHGGFYDVSPVVLEVPYDDRWYLVVDSNAHRIKIVVTEVFDWQRGFGPPALRLPECGPYRQVGMEGPDAILGAA